MHMLRKAILAAACTAGLAAATTPALAQTTLRAVMHSDLKILDPIWTTAYDRASVLAGMAGRSDAPLFSGCPYS